MVEMKHETQLDISERLFPILYTYEEKQRFPSWPRTVPWAAVEEHAEQANRNHGQTVQRLAERGGLAPSELLAVLEDRRWSHVASAVALVKIAELLGLGIGAQE